MPVNTNCTRNNGALLKYDKNPPHPFRTRFTQTMYPLTCLKQRTDEATTEDVIITIDIFFIIPFVFFSFV